MSTEIISLSALADQINEKQAAIDGARWAALERAKEAGELLTDAKTLVPHGQWLPWLEAHCRVSADMAAKYMKLARGVAPTDRAEYGTGSGFGCQRGAQTARQTPARKAPGD